MEELGNDESASNPFLSIKDIQEAAIKMIRLSNPENAVVPLSFYVLIFDYTHF